MSADLKIKVKAMAKQKGMTMSALILEMIEEGYNSRK